MSIPTQIAKHFRDIHFGGNWTGANLRDKVADISFEQATLRIEGLHSIAELVFHMDYYVYATLQVLDGAELTAHDRLSFDAPTLKSEADWQRRLQTSWNNAEALAEAIEELPEKWLEQDFANPEYGTYFRCLQGLTEHCHYHLGQIALIKFLIKRNQHSTD